MALPSLYAFNLLPLNAQIGLVVFEGTFLTNRIGRKATTSTSTT
ncbi:hypothetical protein [Hymenobacter psychrotolerans]|uniref:Uncharacterized protein n=1 Tax=Hymenobacter psychrotolerans DSM 18569 TaxID=1121959 RepID=A0A1M7FDS4_9BACT|nr:hypothetical protein [Hymenobacter psychrotolerans]SHM02150.1 hypothetical protein SAMN02746009_03809 [Hymenobacter psychrotolerans DSM 18569]